MKLISKCHPLHSNRAPPQINGGDEVTLYYAKQRKKFLRPITVLDDRLRLLKSDVADLSSKAGIKPPPVYLDDYVPHCAHETMVCGKARWNLRDGNRIHLCSNAPDLSCYTRRRLIAHEIAHVKFSDFRNFCLCLSSFFILSWAALTKLQFDWQLLSPNYPLWSNLISILLLAAPSFAASFIATMPILALWEKRAERVSAKLIGD